MLRIEGKAALSHRGANLNDRVYAIIEDDARRTGRASPPLAAYHPVPFDLAGGGDDTT
jgi:hypothetical protein